MTLFSRENDFNAEFLKAATELRLPVSSLKGLAAMESAFNPKAYRAEPQIQDGSHGLMQILFRTAKGAGFTGSADDLFDPLTNIRWGGKYFAGLVAKYPKYLDAVASYNMGYPRKASATTKTIIGIYGEPKPDWVYANQPYVDRVAAYTAYYQAVENGDTAKAASVLDAIKKKVTPLPRNLLVLSSSGLLPVFPERNAGWGISSFLYWLASVFGITLGGGKG